MGTFYRVMFGLNLVLPVYEIAGIPARDPLILGEPDAFMFLLVVVSIVGFVLVDIRDRLMARPPTVPG
jgi:hypothetical protein